MAPPLATGSQREGLDGHVLPHCSLRFEVSATIQRRVCEGLKEIARIDIEIEEGVRGARVTSMSQGARAACCRRLGDSGLGSPDFVTG
jgi:hypothetical protein